jgi:DNA polymerase-3 subunit beta
MEFTIQKSDFVKALSRAQSVVDRKSTMPILGNILLQAGETSLTIAATDLSVGIQGNYAANVRRIGSVTVAAKSFYEIIRNLPEEEISCHVSDSNRVTIRSGRAEFKIVGVGAGEYPKLPDTQGVGFSTIDAKICSDMIDKTLFSVSTDETRYHLNGVFLLVKASKLLMVSTDGHRLSMIARPMETSGLSLETGVIIPRKGILEVKKLLEESSSTAVEIGFRGSNVYLRRSDVTLSVKLIDAQFPDYEQVIPKRSEHQAVIPRQRLSDALRRISLLSADKSWGVKFFFTENSLRLASDNPDLGEATEELEISYTGKPMNIGFNARYVLDVLESTSSAEVALRINDELSPGTLSPLDDEEYVCVVMPMRI